jgi:hypothetical protein
MKMKHPLAFFLFLILYFFFFSSFKKDSFITSKDPSIISTSTDSLKYDTVFTQTGSITQSFKIFNSNNQKLLLSKVELMGGNASSFKININGMPTSEADNITIDANDSIYVFVSVTINPNTAKLPFIVSDSILISYNGNSKFVQLQAYGQNAHFFTNKTINNDTTWTNDLPYVILGSLQVSTAATLTIQQGCRIYSHATAPFLVNGTLLINGTKQDSVVFTGDRLDVDYKNLPASWPGIFFLASSNNNVLTHAIIKNANQGLIIDSLSTNGNPKVILHRCIIDNAFDAGIFCYNASLNIDNSLISNCGSNVELTYGGVYNFTNCTVASYLNSNIAHINSVLQVTNLDTATGFTKPIAADFVNCIFWGDYRNVADEVVVNITGNDRITLDHCLYKVADDPSNTDTIAVIKNQDPMFDSVNINLNVPVFNFHITKDSIIPAPGFGKGITINPAFPDLDDNPRVINGRIDLGCYEKQ